MAPLSANARACDRERERGEEKRGAKQADKEVAEARHVLPTRATAAMVVDQ